ncbi:MAG: S8 family serine peptidase [Litorilinea sp.]
MKIRSILIALWVFTLLLPTHSRPQSARAQVQPIAQSVAHDPGDADPRPAAGYAAKISPPLWAEVAQAQTPVSFLAILTEQADPAMLAAQRQSAPAVAAGDASLVDASLVDNTVRAALYRELTATATRTQAPLRAWLDARQIPYQPYYLLNMLEIQGDAALVETLAARAEIARLVANPLINESQSLGTRGDAIPDAPAPTGISQADPATGIEFTRAPSVWELGHRGAGIVVAGGDTGVQWDHPNLQAKYRGWDAETSTVNHDYAWLDAWQAEDADSAQPTICANKTEACDDWGHGTHTMGTMIAAPNGTQLIGMAPDAEWIACRNMRANFGTPAKYTDCFQFFFAPYPVGGDPFVDGDPDRGAHIINNSWGCLASEGCDAHSLREIVETMRAAGIFVVASAGNSGPRCSSVSSPPANHAAAFSVGAHNLAGNIAPFSSRGPVTADDSGRLKPNLVAPGVGIYSTDSNSSYATLQGTSMAAPHVAGAVALLWSAVPALRGDVVMTEEILLKSATPVLNSTCDGDQPPLTPNNTYGYGRLDAYRAALIALSPWNVRVRILAPGGAPLENVTVELEDELTGRRVAAQTTTEGWADLQNIYPGAYTCHIELTAPELGGTGISLLPATDFPDQATEERGLTVGSCRTLDPPAPSGNLYVPSLQRN